MSGFGNVLVQDFASVVITFSQQYKVMLTRMSFGTKSHRAGSINRDVPEYVFFWMARVVE